MMAPLASRALLFAALCALVVVVADLLFTVNSGIFQWNATKDVWNEGAIFLTVFGWSISGAVVGLGVAAARGRVLSHGATALGAIVATVASLAIAFICDRIFGFGASYLLDSDGVAYVEQGLVVVAVWWILSSFVVTLVLSRHQPAELTPNTSLERTRER